MRIKDNEYVDIYNDYDYVLYMPGNGGDGYKLEPRNEDGEPMLVSVLWRDIRYASGKSNVFKTGTVRFEESIEADALTQLKIDTEKEKDYYTREVIEDMVKNVTDDVILEILSMTNKDTLRRFLSVYIGLKNTGNYYLAESVEMYLKARIEELNLGIRKSELFMPTKNEEIEVEKVVEEEKPKKTTRKRTVTKKIT